MIKTPRAIVALFFTSFFLLASCVNRQPELKDLEGPPSLSSAVEQAPTVNFCELIRDPARYDKKIVRTKATFFRNMENAYLYDVSCGPENTYIWVELDPAYSYTKEVLKKKFEQVFCSTQPCPTGRAQVTVVGRFDGPIGGPYGHLDAYRSRFSIVRLEQVEEAGQ